MINLKFEHSNFSVLMPIHQLNQYIDEAIESVLADIPEEVTLFLALHKPDKELLAHFKKYENQANLVVKPYFCETLGKLLNLALLDISTEYIFRMDSDDIWLKGRYDSQRSALIANPEAKVISSGMTINNMKVNSIYNIVHETEREMAWYELLYGCPISHATTLLNRKAVLDSGGYDEIMIAAEDFSLWANLVNKSEKILFTTNIVLYVRIHKDGNSTINKLMQGFEVSHLRVNILLRRYRLSGCSRKHKLASTLSCRYKLFVFYFLQFINKDLRHKKKIFQLKDIELRD